MRKKVLALFVLIMIVVPAVVHAQGTLTLSAVDVSLWPEFDRSSMLVIYRLTLSPQTPLPAEISLRIPSTAVTNAVAVRNPDGSLYNVNYSVEESAGGNRLVFQATTLEVQIEYYDSALEYDGTSRHYSYQWFGDYATETTRIEVQQPVGATDMRISPSLGSGQPGSDGLIYYRSDIGPLADSQKFTISLDYEKPDASLSQDSASVESPIPIDNNAVTLDWSSALPYLLGVLGILLLGGGAYWYWRSGQDDGKKSRRKRGARRRASEPADDEISVEADHVYCHQCGKRAARGDRFCRACGTQLRIH
jgi:hypothetical protein